MENINIVPETFKKNKIKIEEAGFTHMMCSETGDILPLSDFRLHKGKYYMPYCQKIENAMLKIENLKNSIKRMKKSVAEDPKSILIQFDDTNAVKAYLDKRRCSVMAHTHNTQILYFHNRYTSEKILSAYEKYAKDILKKDVSINDIVVVRGK